MVDMIEYATKMARRAYEHHDFIEAVRWFRVIVPNCDQKTCFVAGLCAFLANDKETARKWLSRSNTSGSAYFMSVLLYQDGRFEEARKYLIDAGLIDNDLYLLLDRSVVN